MSKFSTDREKILSEALRSSEHMLDQLNQIATAADNRAMSFTGFAGVMSTLLITTAHSMPVPWLNFAASIFVIIGAISTASSCAPRGFYVAGDRFSPWLDHVKDKDPFVDALQNQGELNDERIDANEKSLAQNAARFARGVNIVLTVSLFAIVLQLFFYAEAKKSCLDHRPAEVSENCQ
jgi:hypothetical protein